MIKKLVLGGTGTGDLPSLSPNALTSAPSSQAEIPEISIPSTILKTECVSFRERATIGTFIAIDRQFFIEVGELDEEMVFWGGENLDLAIRVRAL